jgi:hypothetical protein
MWNSVPHTGKKLNIQGCWQQAEKKRKKTLHNYRND